jgi:hypothetical protein
MSPMMWCKKHKVGYLGIQNDDCAQCRAENVGPREWKCDNCGHWSPDDGSGNDHEGYTCERCGSCMFPEELARLYADGDEGAVMTWRRGK